MNLKTLLQRLKNPGTLLALASCILLILSTLGVVVDDVQILLIIKTLCGVGVSLGILNNPDTPGMDLPGVQIQDNNK